MSESLSVDQMRAALETMSDSERADWVESLRKASANLNNAAYALAGNVPDAKPDPESWALDWLSVGSLQLTLANEALEARISKAV